MTVTKVAIRCGSCKKTHSSVAEVRECFGSPKEAPASPGQVGYAQALMRDRQPTPEYADMSEDRINAMSKTEASAFITVMKGQPFRRPNTYDLPHPEVPEGYYAIVGSDEVIDFYKVVDWRDARYLYHVYGSPGSLEERKVKRPELAASVMDAIAVDPQGASILFGQKLGTCGVCGSPLTNEESRAYGIGPTCRSKKGW